VCSSEATDRALLSEDTVAVHAPDGYCWGSFVIEVSPIMKRQSEVQGSKEGMFNGMGQQMKEEMPQRATAAQLANRK
jgi:hypothetical protein